MILVTGGTGFVGGHVVAALRRAGKDVRCLVRDVRTAGKPELGGCELALGDMTDPASLRAALSETGLVDVEAAIFRQDWRLARRADLLDAILQGTVRAKALLEAQSAAARAAIDAAIAAGMARFGREDAGYALPMPAVIGSGSKG